MKKFLILTIIISGLSLAASPVAAVTYTVADVAAHNISTNCWTIVNSKIYNITSYISAHPGGLATITPLCGTNGTAAFSGQHSGSASANSALFGYYIGDLIVSDITAPTIPTNLTGAVISSSQINLSWNAATDNIAVIGYQIFRNGSQIATTTGTSYNNTGLSASTTYSYKVTAYDAANNISNQSNSISATTLASSVIDILAPTIPTGLTATIISISQINLRWNAATDNIAVTGYQIFRNGSQIATTTITLYNNTGLTASTTYIYTVKAIDAAGNISGLSNSTSTTILISGSTNNQKWQKYYDKKIKQTTKNYNQDLKRLKQKMDKALSKTNNSEKIKKITEKYNQAIKKATKKYNKDIARLNQELQKKLNKISYNGQKKNEEEDDDEEDDD